MQHLHQRIIDKNFRRDDTVDHAGLRSERIRILRRNIFQTTGRMLQHHYVTSGQRILTKSRIACRAVIEDWMMLFAAYTAAETPNGFQCAGQPPKSLLHVRISTPSNDGSLGPLESASQTASRSVQLFFSQYIGVTNTQTRRPRYVWHLSQ